MPSKSEKTFLVILILLLIVCIVLTIFFNKAPPEEYTPKIVNKRVHVIHIGDADIAYTGGTIGMKKTDKGYTSDKGLLETKLKEITKGQGDNIADYTLHEFTPLLNSSNMTPKNWNKIGEYITSVYEDYDAFVVIHGTDTLAYTASALAFMFDNLTKPIVVTGSMVSMQNKRNDGRNNLLASLIYASQYKIPEVVVVFDNKILRGCCTTKVNANSMSGFASPNMPPLGQAGVNIQMNKDLG